MNYSNSVKNLHASVTKDLADLDHSPDLHRLLMLHVREARHKWVNLFTLNNDCKLLIIFKVKI